MTLRIVVNLLHSPAQLTGTGRYAREMVRALAALPEQPEIIGIVSTENSEAFRLELMPANLRLVKWGRPWRDVMKRRLEEWIWLEEFIRELKPDVFWGPTNFLPLMLTFFRHPDSIGRLRGTYWRRWTRRTLRVADRIVTVSHAAAEEIAEYGGVDISRIDVVPNGVDEGFFRAAGDETRLEALRRELPFLPGNYILFVGTLTQHKNLPRLVGALARLRSMPGCEDAQLVLAGKRGEGYEKIARAIHRNGLEKAVVELGFVQDELLPALYAGARLAVLPSLNEGFGLPIIEAMATGTPVVTSNTGAMAEVGRDCAILVDVNKKSAIAGGLADLWRDDGLHERLRKMGMARARDFTWCNAAQQLFRILQEAAADRS
jgi:glycosyltransferase involved in cell wall biosynthesis